VFEDLLKGSSLSTQTAVQCFYISGLIGTIISLVVIKFFGRRTIMIWGAAIQTVTLALAGLSIMKGYAVFGFACILIASMA